MGLLESFRKGLRKDKDFKQAQKNEKIARIIQERKKSSNERILEKHLEERRQQIINEKVKKITKMRNDELFNTAFQPTKNIFHENNNPLKVKNTMLKSNKNIMGNNIFFK